MQETDNTGINPVRKRKNKRIIRIIVIFVILILFIWGFTMQTVRYSIDSDKTDQKIKIMFISDLHNCFYGGFDQSGLMKKIDAENPDLVLFGGDAVDQYGGTEHALKIMELAAGSYPCCYTPGNHEYEREDTDDFKKQVAELGISVLEGESAEFIINDTSVEVFGVLDSLAYGESASQLEECISELDEDSYNILLAHQPEQIDEYRKGKFDLILSGHAHGGQWRLPFVLEQGLYSPDQGLFPEYTNGLFEYDNTVHIISKGLAKPLRMIFIPRIFNRPELTIIEIS